jgi:tetratricopeptide (TPR) repeat protein
VLAWNNRGEAYENIGKRDLALEAYSKAVELNPKYARAWKNRGDIYAAQGNKERAAVEYRKALALDPSYKFAQEALKRLGLER